MNYESIDKDKDEILVSVEHIRKKFCRSLKRSLAYGVAGIIREVSGSHHKNNTRLRKGEFWALDDVSFQLKRGEAIGLIGQNGSGKTTLLRVISGLIKPDAGIVRTRGSLAPLIALGAGFSPVLTGRENIYVNMGILGFSKREIDTLLPAVLDFAQIGDAVDSPVRTYSSGMAARLGFACAIHTSPDVLLIDEVLAVGDVKFRAKCYRRLAELREQGTAFILVSHNSLSIRTICDKAIYLSDGKVVSEGSSDRVMEEYENRLLGYSGITSFEDQISLPDEEKISGIQLKRLFLKDKNGNKVSSLVSGEPFSLCITTKAYRNLKNLNINIIFTALASEKQNILFISTVDDTPPFSTNEGMKDIELYFPYCALKPGTYSSKINITRGRMEILDVFSSFKFLVKRDEKGLINDCEFYQPRQWLLKDEILSNSHENSI